MPIGNWKGNHPGCNCFQLTKTCSKACDIRVERHNITKMLLWKQKRFCVEEIKQWSFNRNGACPENYISDSNTPYCIKSAQVSLPITNLKFVPIEVNNFKLEIEKTGNNAEAFAFFDISVGGNTCINKMINR